MMTKRREKIEPQTLASNVKKYHIKFFHCTNAKPKFFQCHNKNNISNSNLERKNWRNRRRKKKKTSFKQTAIVIWHLPDKKLFRTRFFWSKS